MKRKTNICDILKILRIANDLSIKQLSDKSGISVSYITELEKGKKTKPSIDTIDKYAKAFGLKKSVIIGLLEKFEMQDYDYQLLLANILKVFTEHQKTAKANDE